MELEKRKCSELEWKKQTKELKVGDITFYTFVLPVAMVTESYMVLFCMYICINQT